MRAAQSFAYQPALDGLRAVAVAVVLLFHAQVPGFDGGYLGVSVFFTLSGYLITSLLLVEHANGGRLAISAFYARRARRLLPASVVCLAAIVVISATTTMWDGVADLRREVVGAALQVSNWVFLGGEGSYQQLFQSASGARSPVEHFWSLSIEEQFYWVWPPIMALVLSRATTRRGRTAIVALMAVVASLAAPIIAIAFGPDAAYWATPARVAEILIGCLLAMLIAGRQLLARVAWLGYVGALALAVCIAAFPASGGPAYHGWMPLVAVGSAAVVLGLQVASPLRTVLATPPLVWLGGISYGVYVFHWPIFLILDDQFGSQSRWLMVPIQIAVTLAVAQVSYVCLERPIRNLRGDPQLTVLVGGAVTVAAMLMAIVLVPKPSAQFWQADAASVAAAAIEPAGAPLAPVQVEPPVAVAVTVASSVAVASAVDTTLPAAAPETIVTTVTPAVSPSAPATTTPSTTQPPASTLPELSRPIRVVVAGDSTADALGFGLVSWAAENPDLAQAQLVDAPGCGVLRDGERDEGEWKPVPDFCDDWLDTELPDAVAFLRPDVVVVMVSSWDVLDHRWNDGPVESPLDAGFADRLEADYRALITELLGRGAGNVVWIDPPVPRPLWSRAGTGQMDPARHAAVREVIDSIAADLPESVSVVDLAGWLEQHGLSGDKAVRPDGVHLDPGWSTLIANELLGPTLVSTAVS